MAVVERLFGQLGRTLVAVAVMERWPLKTAENKGQYMGFPPGHKKVAVVKRWPLVEVRLYRTTHERNALSSDR